LFIRDIFANPIHCIENSEYLNKVTPPPPSPERVEGRFSGSNVLPVFPRIFTTLSVLLSCKQLSAAVYSCCRCLSRTIQRVPQSPFAGGRCVLKSQPRDNSKTIFLIQYSVKKPFITLDTFYIHSILLFYVSTLKINSSSSP